MHEHGVGRVKTSKTLEADSQSRMMKGRGRSTYIDCSFPVGSDELRTLRTTI